eukprot:192657-Rhodomonas_salina.3
MEQNHMACRLCIKETVPDTPTYATVLLTKKLSESIEDIERKGLVQPLATIICMDCGNVSALSFKMHELVNTNESKYNTPIEYYTSVLALCSSN